MNINSIKSLNNNILCATTLLVYLSSRMLAIYVTPFFDDAYITFRHTSNFVDGHGLTFNIGQSLLGTTSPLYALLLAVPVFFHVPIETAALLLALLSELTLLFFVWLIAKRMDMISGWVIFCAIILADRVYTRDVIGGMESPLFLVITIVALFYASSGRIGNALIISSMAIWVRPEGFLLTGILGIYLLLHKESNRIPKIVAASLVVIVPAIFIYWIYGSVIPQSVAAKSIENKLTINQVLAFFFWAGGKNSWPWIVMTLAMIGFLPVVIRLSREFTFITIWSLVYLLFYIVMRPPLWVWYGLPLFFVRSAVIAFGIAYFIEKYFARTWKIAALSIVLLLPILYWTHRVVRDGKSGETEYLIPQVQEISRTFVHPSDTVCVSDVGVFGFISKAILLDRHGLVWKDYYRYDSNADILRNLHPHWAYLNVGTEYREVLNDTILSHLYKPVARASVYGPPTLTVSENELERGWNKDYILLQRVDVIP